MILFYFPHFARKRISSFCGLSLFSLVLLSCAIPQKIESNKPSRTIYPAPIFLNQKGLPEDTIILDTRSYFDYSVSHLNEAFHQDYRLYLARESLWPTKNLDRLSASLARKGIGPDTSVLVLGEGVRGHGQECRVAWTLYYMGLPKVSFIRHDFLKGKRNNEEVSLPEKSYPYWQLQKNEKLLADYKYLKKTLEKEDELQILDVRDPESFLTKRHEWDAEVDAKVMNLHWKKILKPDSSFPDEKSLDRLLQLGWKKSTPTIILDEKGLGGACAAMALMSYGFKEVRYYAGSYQDLDQKWQK